MFDNPLSILFALIYFALAASFFYKSLMAILRGTYNYWEGFLPLTILSPLWCHAPSRPGNLVKTGHGWWVHITFGPAFLILSILLATAAAEELNLPAVSALNHWLTIGKPTAGIAISYRKGGGFSFPIFKEISEELTTRFGQPVLQNEYNPNDVGIPPKSRH